MKCDSDRLDGPSLLSCRPHPYPTICPFRVACHLRWSGRSSSSWSPLFGGRQSAALPVWTFSGAKNLGKTGTWCPPVVFFARWRMLDTLADWWGLQRHYGGIGGLRSVSRLSSPIPGPCGSWGHTCRGSTARETAHAVRLIRPQGLRPRVAAWRACSPRSHAVGCCWSSDTQWGSKQHGRSALAP